MKDSAPHTPPATPDGQGAFSQSSQPTEQAGNRLPVRHTRLMGIVNITPDSFSDGGVCASPESALAQARRLLGEGADILDLGAESTRPGAPAVSAEEEWARLQPALAAIRAATAAPLSIDTYKAAVADLVLTNGADWINDIWGLQADEGQMAETIARHNATVVIMHNRADSDYRGDLIEAILEFWQTSIDRARSAGIAAQRIILDPGIGFGKTLAHNWEVLRRFEQLRAIGPYPLLLGASRKSFLGLALQLPVNERDEATLATSVIAVQKGADILRVHNVLPHARAIAAVDYLLGHTSPRSC